MPSSTADLDSGSLRGPALTRTRTIWLIVGFFTLVGFVLRVCGIGQTLFADELSSMWITRHQSLGHVLSSIRSDDEITPPLFFVLAWASQKLGSSPDLARLPSIVAGTASIPLLYALGARTVGRYGAMVAAALFSLSPFLIFYSVEARSYSVAIAFVIGSTLALVCALEKGGRWRWFAYAACSCLAMLSHYTAVFPLIGQLIWALAFHRDKIRSLAIWNGVALIGFLPWIPGFIADNNSPTTTLLSVLQPFNLDAIRSAIETWTVGYPLASLSDIPGVGLWLTLAGLLVAAAGLIRLAAERIRGSGFAAALAAVPIGFWLVCILALSNLVGGSIASALGPNVVAARNLGPSLPGLALAIGAIISVAGPVLAPVAAALVIAGFGFAGVKAMQSGAARPNYRGAAEYINANSRLSDPVVDGAAFTPVPLTSLDLYLRPGHPEYRLGIAPVDHPFRVGDPLPVPGDVQVNEALGKARDGRLYYVYSLNQVKGFDKGPDQGYLPGGKALPPGYRIVGIRSFPSYIGEINVLVIAGPKAPAAQGGQ